MVSSQKTAIGSSESLGQQHINGPSGSVPPLAPAKLAGSVWVVGNNVIPNCNSYSSSDQEVAANFVETIAPAGAGTTPGMLGYMFWGGGCQGNGTVCTFPPDTFEAGVGAGATALNIPIPMPPLRQNYYHSLKDLDFSAARAMRLFPRFTSLIPFPQPIPPHPSPTTAP